MIVTFVNVENPCDPDHCMYESQCNPVSNADIYQCNCRPGYTGRHCEKEPPLSCKDALDKGKSHGNGEYYIDPERTGTAFPVYCDMTNEGGGWMMVLNLTYDASRAAFTPDSSFRSLSKFKEGYMGLTSNAMGQLQSFTSFTQMRFYCHKQGVGRTLHIITTPDSKGKAVVDYFSAKTDALAFACDSFTEGTGNNAMLTGRCQKWGRDKSGAQYVGVWGHGFKLDETWRMYDHPMYEAHMYHVILRNGYHNCDDTGSTETNGDSWETYVR
ncbi:fibrinogen beta chain isoform X1 [Nematostella vectensis]|uniref:fibrinogen beta chain isoform X1 n=1 Tax=Nematostella vectensis TaxID=45351 RepID=UPI00138FAEE4|nr:fibrinogen beta chain isoform X1 [Nematostella vectensis]